jgi:hypothetical protein
MKTIGTRAHLAVLAACAIIPCSCKTTGDVTPSPQGMATFDSVPKKELANGITGSRVVRLNGKQLRHPTRSLDLHPGTNTITVEFEWPSGGSATADLALSVVEGRKYSLGYYPFPWAKIDGMSGARPLHDMSGMDVGAALYLPVAVATRTAEQTAKFGALATRRAKEERRHIEYTDIVVISSSRPEGVVCRQRVEKP